MVSNVALVTICLLALILYGTDQAATAPGVNIIRVMGTLISGVALLVIRAGSSLGVLIGLQLGMCALLVCYFLIRYDA